MVSSRPTAKNGPISRPSFLGGLSIRDLAVGSYSRLIKHEVSTRAAAIAYYAFAALVPFLGLVLTLVVTLLPDFSTADAPDSTAGLAVAAFRSSLEDALPGGAVRIVENQIARIQQDPPVGLISVGLVIAAYLASSLFSALIASLNRIFGTEESRPLWKIYAIAIGMTILQAAVLIAAFTAIVLWPQVIAWLGLSGSEAWLASGLRSVLVVLVLLLSFSLLFYLGPDTRQRWEWITPGSVIGTVVFLGAAMLFRIYVQNFGNYDKTYGSLGGVIILLGWLWLMGHVVLGAGAVNATVRHALCPRELELRGERHAL